LRFRRSDVLDYVQSNSVEPEGEQNRR
jgi:hypothetical protein